MRPYRLEKHHRPLASQGGRNICRLREILSGTGTRHTYTAELVDVAVDDNLRRALASAARALEEMVALARKLQKQALDQGHDLVQGTWGERVREYQRELDVVRDAMLRMESIAAKAAE